MKRLVLTLAFMALVAPFAQMAPAATTNYVAQGGQTPAPPYASWATAASNIQDAISQAIAGDTVLVSNGLYEVGGVTNFPTGTVLTNRIAIYKAITVQAFSTNPADTLIKGAWASGGTTNGPDAIRCVWMTNGSTLIGFTLTNGATLAGSAANDTWGGGVYCQTTNTVVSNCVIAGNSAGQVGGGASYGTLYNCTLTRNSSSYGGGTRAATLFNCTLTGNSASISGGGTYYGTLNTCTLIGNSTADASGNNGGGGNYFGTLTNCTLSGNSTSNRGGGARGGTLFNCTLISNSAVNGGGGADGNGTYDCTLSNCTLIGNSATGWQMGGGGAANANLYNCTLIGNSAGPGNGSAGAGGASGKLYNCTIISNSAPGGNGGGVRSATLFNCTLVGNSCTYYGGAASASALYNCTIVGSSAVWSGGGVDASTLYNCISWSNNIVDTPGAFNFSCGVGYTNGGSVSGNITSDPLFITNGSGYGTNHVAGNYRLRNESPPLNIGTNFSWLADPADVRSKDLDGSRRIDRFSGQVDMGCYELLSRGTLFTIFGQ